MSSIAKPSIGSPIKKGIRARLTRGFTFSMINRLGTQFIAFFTAPIYARALTPEQYGTISLANSIRQILLVLMPLGAAAGVSYWYNLHRKEPKAARHAVGAAGGLTLASSAIFLCLGLVTGPWLLSVLFPDFPLPFWPYGAMVLATAWLIVVETVPTRFLHVREKQDVNAYLGIGTAVLQIGFVLTFVAFLQRGPGGQIEAMFLYAAVNGVFYFWLMQRETPVRADRKLWKEMLFYGLPMVPHQLSVYGLNVADRLIIGHYGETYSHDLGLYSFGYNIAHLMAGITTSFSTVWSAVYMEQARSNPKAPVTLGRAASWSFLGFSVLAAGLILGGQVLVALIGSDRYAGSERFIAPVVVAYLMQGLYLLPTMAMFHTKKTHWMFTITATAVVVNIGLNLLLIPRFGVIAAAWTTLVGFTIMAILGFVWGHRLFPLRYVKLPFALSAPVIALAWIGAARLPDGVGGTAAKIGLWLALAGASGAAWQFSREKKVNVSQ